MGKKPIEIHCEDCGKEMPIDHDKSNENWKVYEMKCECGGEGKLVY